MLLCNVQYTILYSDGELIGHKKRNKNALKKCFKIKTRNIFYLYDQTFLFIGCLSVHHKLKDI